MLKIKKVGYELLFLKMLKTPITKSIKNYFIFEITLKNKFKVVLIKL